MFNVQRDIATDVDGSKPVVRCEECFSGDCVPSLVTLVQSTTGEILKQLQDVTCEIDDFVATHLAS